MPSALPPGMDQRTHFRQRFQVRKAMPRPPRCRPSFPRRPLHGSAPVVPRGGTGPAVPRGGGQLKFLIASPSLLPRSPSRLVPNTKSTITKMSSSSGKPRLPNIAFSPLTQGYAFRGGSVHTQDTTRLPLRRLLQSLAEPGGGTTLRANTPVRGFAIVSLARIAGPSKLRERSAVRGGVKPPTS